MKYCNSYKDLQKIPFLSNQVCFLFLGIFYLYFLLFKWYHLSILIFGFVLIYGFIFCLNYKNKFELSRLLLIMTINCGVYVFGALCGEKSGISNLFFRFFYYHLFYLNHSKTNWRLFLLFVQFLIYCLTTLIILTFLYIIISESLYPILYSSVYS